MRKNRNSDVVTSSHADSEEEQEQSVDDSEEDWKPEKVKIHTTIYSTHNDRKP